MFQRNLPNLAALALLLTASLAHAALEKPDQVIACTGPFAKNATHASLLKAFGVKNVTVQRVGIGEGETVTASVIFPRDPARRIDLPLNISSTRS